MRTAGTDSSAADGRMPLFDDEAAAFLDEVYQRADAFLFGRRTYEIFAGSWGTGSWGADQGDNPISVALNTRPKYVASTTLTDPQWADTTVLSGDVAAAIGELKAKPGGELQVHGSGALVRWLLDNRPVDEIILFIVPGGRRPGHAAVPRRRPGCSARPGRLAVHSRWGVDPGLPAHRAPAVRNGHGRLRLRRWLTWNRSGRGWRSCRSSSSRASTTGCTPSSPTSSSA